ncbi:MAG: type IV pili twitching motility protein PilT, partial [Thermodesulfobacteriota bacterium]
KGRCAAAEILLCSQAVANMIRESKLTQIHSIIQTGSAEGMQTMDQALQKLVNEKRITPEAAYFKALDKSIFADQCADPILE